MSLVEYRRKRNFIETPEPRGRVRAGSRHRTRIFVVQKHDASRLHYDFRLEIDHVLASWAVPKGPSMNPTEKRLAVRTEDHPLDYADFEGVIPKGQYGAGTVMVWDTGPYESKDHVSLEKQLARGRIDVQLDGSKLRGGFTLLKTAAPSADRRQTNKWLLIKHRDEHADPSWRIEAPALSRSVLTGRTMNEITHGRVSMDTTR
jgi:bifunctional non-homologous end joining protein LigD